MNIRESIKSLLNLGVTVKKPFKDNINDWYSEFSLSPVYSELRGGLVYLSGFETFFDVDLAVEFFMSNCFTSKNKGYIQERLSRKVNLDRHNLTKPSEELIQLFEDEGKIVDEEYKTL